MNLSALQLILVLTPDWHDVEGKLYRYQRSSPQQKWSFVAGPIPIVVGKNGMAKDKREGDGKTPIGAYALGPVFGDGSHRVHAVSMPFLPITDDMEWVDDPRSQYYNRYVYTSSNIEKDWTSSEQMAKIGFLYSIGVFVRYNSDPIEPGKGSCIFMHVWRDSKSGTGGCTAMEERHLNEIVSWLDQTSQPCIVQLPLQEYITKKQQWNLPDVL